MLHHYRDNPYYRTLIANKKATFLVHNSSQEEPTDLDKFDIELLHQPKPTSLVTHDVTVQLPSDTNQEHPKQIQLEPLPYGRKYAYTPPDAYDSDTSALDNESQELEGPSLRYYATDGQFYMGRRVYHFSEFPKKIGPLPEPEYRPMSYSLIGDYVTEEERDADRLYEQNLQDWKHDNISYLKGLTPDQLKMWKLHYHIELE